MKLFNSMTSSIEEFKPIHENQVNMYVCGPTVYNYPHIGNARPIVVFDTLKRVFMALGYEVKMVSNYTDVDDKIIKTAMQQNVSEKEISEKFIEAYNKDRLALNAMMPDVAPRVTETMDEIIAFIDLLVKKGHAYQVDGDVYFRVKSVGEYGSLSNQQIEDLQVGARIDENSKKENPLDFTLWKATQDGIKWQSPWSLGRPGWHTECVVMINEQFNGDHLIDIHGGGMDLKFPHHENEIAQSKAAYDSPIANYWVHNGMVNIDGIKMSKSLGNVIWAKDMIAQVGANIMRWIFLSAHYRAPLNINDKAIDSANKEFNKVANALKQAYVKLALEQVKLTEEYDDSLYLPFIEAMSDDLNTPNAFAALFEAVKVLNQNIRKKDFALVDLGKQVVAIEKMLKVLGIEIARIEFDEEALSLYKNWQACVKAKDFDQADAYRKQLIEKGIL